MILTFILALSVVGWALLIPHQNDSKYYKPLSELRSSWMTVGIEIKDKLLYK